MAASLSIAPRLAAAAAQLLADGLRFLRFSSSMRIELRRNRMPVALISLCGCISIRKKSSNKSLTNVGDYILAVNGVELKAPDNIFRLLDGTANRQTSLTINDKPTMDGARHVIVVPVANEQTLRTRAWVEANRRMVEKLSDGPLAYV